MNDHLTLREYQRQASRTDSARGTDLKSIMIPLLGLAGEAGSLLAEYKKWLREGERYKLFTDQVSEEIGDILWYLANIADKAGLDLQDVAQENLAKLADRFGGTIDQRSQQLLPGIRYDASFPLAERLPLKMKVLFEEVQIGGDLKLKLTFDGDMLGDHLTDNSHVDDGYRYHDVFHLGYAMMLGWSPTLRKLLRVKRRSIPKVDEVEDGARAAVTEEAIAAIVFGHAREHSFYEGATTVDYELLRAIKLITSPFEIRDRSYREWEHVILKSFEVWRQMVANRGGWFIGDAERRSISYVARAS